MSRYPKSTKDENGNRLCRRCKKPVPQGRQTWCSNECYEQVQPNLRFQRIVKRDQRCMRCSDWYAKTNQEYCDLRGFVAANLSYVWTVRTRALRPVWEIDHKVPLALGGSDEDDNLQLLCGYCHKQKTRDDRRAIAMARKQKNTNKK